MGLAIRQALVYCSLQIGAAMTPPSEGDAAVPMPAKPTPGPWIVSDAVNDIDGKDVKGFRVTTSDGLTIMDALNSDFIEVTEELPSDIDDCTRYFDWQSLANARLMAAAPEMLAVLQSVAHLKGMPDQIRDDIARAIVKATTRSPYVD